LKQAIDRLADGSSPADMQEVIEEVDMSEESVEDAIQKLKHEGELMEPKQGKVQKI